MSDHASRLLDRDYSGQPEALTPAYKSSQLRAPCQPLLRLPETVRDVTGPVFGHDKLGELDANLVINAAAPNQSALGPRILVHGCVLDENGKGVPGALLEVWQANAGGRYRHKTMVILRRSILILPVAGAQSRMHRAGINFSPFSLEPILGPIM